jgi:hypothetical protein
MYHNKVLDYSLIDIIQFREIITNKNDFIQQYIKNNIPIINESFFYSNFDLLSIYIPENCILAIYNKKDYNYYFDYLFIGPCIIFDTHYIQELKTSLYRNKNKYYNNGLKNDNNMSIMYYDDLKKILLNKSIRLFEYDENYSSILINTTKTNKNKRYNNINITSNIILNNIDYETKTNFIMVEKKIDNIIKKRKMQQLKKYKSISNKGTKLYDSIDDIMDVPQNHKIKYPK